MPGFYAGRQEVVASSQQALRRTSEPADRHTYSACNLKKGIVPPVAWLRVKDGVLRSHFALRMSSQINRSLSTELFCSKSIRSNMTLSLISLLYKDIAELWLLLKKCTGVSSISNFLSCLIAGQAGTLPDNVILLRKMGCVLVQRWKLYSACVHSCINIIYWGVCVLSLCKFAVYHFICRCISQYTICIHSLYSYILHGRYFAQDSFMPWLWWSEQLLKLTGRICCCRELSCCWFTVCFNFQFTAFCVNIGYIISPDPYWR